MSVEVKVPTVGESITSGVLSVWHKKDGESVQSGDVLFTLETDKVSSEVVAPESGVLKTQAAEGDEVKIGQVVALIEAGAPRRRPRRQRPRKPRRLNPQRPSRRQKRRPNPNRPAPAPAPKAEKSAAPAPSAKPKIVGPDDPRTTRKKMSPLRRKIATQLVMAQHTAAILTTFNECDMSAVMALRKQMQEEFTKKHGREAGLHVVLHQIRGRRPQGLARDQSRIDGDELIQNNYYDIGVAVGTERGLIVPVVRDADKKSFADIERELGEYAVKAREGKIGLEDLQGGIFTISNGGVYGSLLSTPILNPPQSGILACTRSRSARSRRRVRS